MSIFVIGSMAFDRIMTFPGKFEEHILQEKLHILNVCFIIDKLKEKRGGTAGNIAYSLALLGEKPTIVSTVGKDFDSYKKKLIELGLPLHGLRIETEEYTAAAYITTDISSNQITGFYPAAMNIPTEYNFENNNSLAIIGPGNFDDMRRLPTVFKQKGIKYIFDPGQQIPLFSADELIQAISGAYIFITNDYELEMVSNITKKTRAQLQELCSTVITTFGEKGSAIFTGDAEIVVGIAKPRAIIDPTGCGDAYRAGLIKGIVCGFSLEKSAQMGAVCASFCVEEAGPQEHSFNLNDFIIRYKEAFAENLVLK